MQYVNALFELVGAALAWSGWFRSKRSAPSEVRLALGWSALWGCSCVPYYLSVGDRLNAALAAVRAVGLVLWAVR